MKNRNAQIRFTLMDDDGDETHYEMPGEFAVCSRCNGTGVHTNPAIDGNGISPEEFAEDPDFEEAYFGGRYDVTCEKCRGERVVVVASPRQWSFAQKRAYVMHLRYERERAHERYCDERVRRMESGGY